jgi:very-short-patch-repair endonuclease
MTPPEAALWAYLRQRVHGRPNVRRQHPVGPYILDFFCAPAKLAIEIDGRVHETADNPEKDARRTAWLNAQGIEVVRIPAAEVLRDAAEVAEGVLQIARLRIGLADPHS